MSKDSGGIKGTVTWELRGPDGEVKQSGVTRNLITDIGDTLYGSRGIGGTTTALPTGMKLGTGTTAVAKNGAGAALVTYLSNSDQAFDATYPSGSDGAGTGYVATYKVTYAAGKATTSGSPIAEAVIVNDTLADGTSTASATISRVLISPTVTKGASDTLTVTWTHTLLGS